MMGDRFVNVVGLCDAVHRLKDGTGWTTNMLAKQVGVSASTIRAWLLRTKERPLFINGKQRWALRTRLRSVKRFEATYQRQMGEAVAIETHAC